MVTLARILDPLVPTRCAGCGVPGDACCARCRTVWDSLAEIARGPTAGLVPVYALARYRGVARRLVLAYKERGRRDLAPALGAALAGAVSELTSESTVYLVPVPSRRPVSRMRGGPHMHRLARSCARALAAAGRPAAVAPALSLGRGARDSVGLDRSERAANLVGRLHVCEPGLPPPETPVVLLDDVVTTGATVAACVKSLIANGIRVSAVVVLTGAG